MLEKRHQEIRSLQSFRVYLKIHIAISQVYTIYTTKYIILHIQYIYIVSLLDPGVLGITRRPNVHIRDKFLIKLPGRLRSYLWLH